jgi:nucleoside-diphosphate-sugar epimerase
MSTPPKNARRILVLGATGFIGRNIAESLAAEGDGRVIGVYNRKPPFEHPDIDWLQADLTQFDDVFRCLKGADVVIQAAATTSGAGDITRRPYIHVADNAVMNAHIFRAAFDHAIPRLVYFSCAIMYSPAERPVREDDFTGADGMHASYFGAGWTKVYGEKMCQFYAGLGRTAFTVIRHSNVYGPHDKFDLERSHVLGATVTKAMTAADGKLAMWGTGEETRDLLFVSDLVDFVRRAIDGQDTAFELVNVGSGSAVSIRALAERIAEASGRALEIVFEADKPTIRTRIELDCTRARQIFGWTPKVTLEDGIAKTVAWWRENVA